jgi:hypothetical protein
MTTVNNLSVWPETLPPPRVEGYSLSPRPSLLRTEMETGSARHRLRSLTAHYQVQAEWRFSEFQFAVFDAWWALNTRLGEQWFVLPLAVPLDVQAVEARFLVPRHHGSNNTLKGPDGRERFTDILP